MTDRRDHLRIFCYHASPIVANATLNIASLYIRTHFETTYPELKDKVTWLLPEQWQMTDDQLIEYCVQNKVDILSTSHYVWNDLFVLDQLQRVRTQLPDNIIVCSGGPSVRVKIEPDYLEKHWYINYAFFAQGESGFADLLHSLLTGTKLILFNTSNIAWYDKKLQRSQIANFKYIPEPKISPYLHCADFLREIKLKTPHIERVTLAYQLTRGCPYSCTFCDWNGGFTNKTSRRKNSYQAEIDLFQELGFRAIFLVDANVGQYDEDVDMIQYMATKNLKEGTKFWVNGSMSKLRKDNALKVWRIMADSGMLPPGNFGVGFPISAQDINEEVLKNIDRPDIGWEEHKRIINELRRDYPDHVITIQLIYGLPGQTVTSWKQSCSEISKEPVSLMMCAVNEFLPTSPAALDPNYESKFKFEYVLSERYYNGIFIYTKLPASCISFNRADLIEMTLTTIAFVAIVNIRFDKLISMSADVGQTVERLLLTEEFAILRENLRNNWFNENKFYFTRWFGPNGMNEQIHTACQLQDFLALAMNKTFIELMVANIDSQHVYQANLEARYKQIENRQKRLIN